MPPQTPQNLPSLEGKKPSETFETDILGESTMARPESKRPDPPSFWSLSPGTRMETGLSGPETVPEGSPTAYVLHRMIARGGCGEVWEATQTSMGRSVAVKRMRADIASKLGNAEWEFRQEAVTAAQLEHPNIVPVHDLGRDDAGRPVIAMKLVRGRPWSEVLREEFAVMSATDFLARHLPTLMATTHAVAFAHSKGIVHRDLKPSQVMTGEFGEVLLMDWGLAIATPADSTTPPSFSLPSAQTASSPSGTPAYMAPEQTRNRATDVGPWTDVYLLGAILYDLLTGQPPHHAETAQLAFTRACSGEVVPPRKQAPDRDIPVALEAICLRALSIDPKDRHLSARHFLDDLNDFVTGSTRRREALALLDTARERLNIARGNYAELTEVMSLASRARELWPESNEPKRIEQDAVALQSQSALDQGDLVLARLQADRVADSDRRQALHQAIGAAEEQQRRLASQRRLAFAASFVLFAVLVVSSVIYSQRIATERDAAEVARADASDARDRAVDALDETQALVGFMLKDLRARIAPRDAKLELLDVVARRAQEHYSHSLAIAKTDHERARVAQGTLELGEVFRLQGLVDEAEATFGEARKITAAMELLEPDSISWRRATSTASQGIAQSRSDRGDFVSAAKLMEEDYAALERMHQRFPKNADLISDMLTTGSWIALAYEKSGRASELATIRKSLLEVADLLQRVDPTSMKPVNYRSTVNTARARELELEGKGSEARQIMADMIADMTASMRTLPVDKETSRSLAVAQFRYANMIYRNDDLAQAEALCLASKREYELLMRVSPGDLTIVHEMGVLNSLLTRIYLAGMNLSEARETAEARVKSIEGLLERDPQNSRWLYEVASAYEDMIQINSMSGNREEATANVAKAREAIMRALELPGETALLKRQLVSIENQSAALAFRAQDWDAAAESFGHAIKSMKEDMAAGGETSPREQNNLANLMANCAAALRQGGRFAEAREVAREELALREGIYATAPEIDPHKKGITAATFSFAELSMMTGNTSEGLEPSARAITFLRGGFTEDSTDNELRRRLGQQLSLRARLLAANDDAEKTEVAREALRLLRAMSELSTPDPNIVQAALWAAIILDDRETITAFLPKLPKKLRSPEIQEALNRIGVE